MAYLNFNLQLFTAILMIIVFSGNLMTGYSRMRSFSFFLLLMLSDIVMLLTGAADNYVLYKTSIYEHYRWLEALLSGVSDLSYFAILGFFILYLDSYEKDDSKRSVFALLGSITAAISGIFWLVTDFIGGIYTQNAESIAYEPLYMLGQSGGYFTCIFTVIILIKRWKCFSHRERAGFVMFIGIPFVGSFFKWWIKDIIIMPLLVTISILFIQSFIQFTRELLLRKQQTDIARIQAELVTSRLKPHFIYNVLNTIYSLVEISSTETQKAISLFAGYLRSSLIDIDNQRLIPFESEFEHVKDYLEIEKIRFGDKISVDFDMKAMDFMIPPLALLTVVENAVNYSVEKKPEGGSVSITSEKIGHKYVVTVSDSGDGFDASKISLTELKADDKGKKHVGLYSTAYRLRNMCNGDLKIDSRPGQGTVVTLEIMGEQNDEYSGS